MVAEGSSIYPRGGRVRCRTMRPIAAEAPNRRTPLIEELGPIPYHADVWTAFRTGNLAREWAR
jgi:hypothetical protein